MESNLEALFEDYVRARSGSKYFKCQIQKDIFIFFKDKKVKNTSWYQVLKMIKKCPI